jgi:hypothetical protein
MESDLAVISYDPVEGSPMFDLPWQEDDMRRMAYSSRCPFCGADMTSISCLFGANEIVPRFHCQCGRSFLECKPVYWLGALPSCFRYHIDTGIMERMSGENMDCLKVDLWLFSRIVVADADPIDLNGVFISHCYHHNCWHMVMDHLYKAYYTSRIIRCQHVVFVPSHYEDFAKIVMGDRAQVICGDEKCYSLDGSFCYSAEPTHRDVRNGMTIRDRWEMRRRNRVEYLSHISSTIRPMSNASERKHPMVMFSFRSGLREWSPQPGNLIEFCKGFERRHPDGEIVIHSMPSWDRVKMGEEWGELLSLSIVTPCIDVDFMSQMKTTAMCDVMVSPHSSALALGATFGIPLVVMGEASFVRRELLYRKMIEIPTDGMNIHPGPRSEFRFMHPNDYSFDRPPVDSVLDAVDDALSRDSWEEVDVSCF